MQKDFVKLVINIKKKRDKAVDARDNSPKYITKIIIKIKFASRNIMHRLQVGCNTKTFQGHSLWEVLVLHPILKFGKKNVEPQLGYCLNRLKYVVCGSTF